MCKTLCLIAVLGTISCAVNQARAQDQLGTVSSVVVVNCVASPVPGTCYNMVVSCPSVADALGHIKVTLADNPVGTLVLASGGNGLSLWEQFPYGQTVLDNFLAAGYSFVQMHWTPPYGWQTGPGGIRRVACRPATLINWIYNNINPNASTPMCAAGTSAGSEQVGLSLAHYGIGSILAMAELISGPPFAREDYACECNQPTLPDPCGSMNLNLCIPLHDAEDYVDPAYVRPFCANAVTTHSTVDEDIFLGDSILSPDGVLAYPNTYVHFVFGGLDTGAAPVMGQLYEQAITTNTAFACVADAKHIILNYADGAAQVSSDLISGCHLSGSERPRETRERPSGHND
jgi:hypothetical protein